MPVSLSIFHTHPHPFVVWKWRWLLSVAAMGWVIGFTSSLEASPPSIKLAFSCVGDSIRCVASNLASNSTSNPASNPATHPTSNPAIYPTSNPARVRFESSSSRWWSSWYLLDWGLTLGLGVGGSLLLELVSPPVREWSPGDLGLTRPLMRDNLFPMSVGLSVGVPVVGLALAQIHIKSGHNFHHALLGWAESLALAAFFTQLLQVTTGHLRPDWFERCRPNIESLQCTGDVGLVQQGRRSFPSLEASLAWAGGTYLALYMAGHFHPWKGWDVAWKIPVMMLPLAGATLISMIPALENRHHAGDIVAGALVGAGFAILAYHLNFYPLWTKKTNQSRARTRLTWMPLFLPQGGGIVIQGEM